MANKFHIEILKQMFAIKIGMGRDTIFSDFKFYTSDEYLVTALKELELDNFLEVHSLGSDKSYRLSRKGRSQLKVVLTGGAYDLLHTGHITTLKEAADFGNFLLVVVAKDVTVEGRKRKPIHSEVQRMKLLNEIQIVDLAVIGDRTDHMAIVRETKPDIIAIGSDQDHRIKILQKQLIEEGLTNTEILRLTSNLEGLSTTEVITEILERFV